MQKCVGMCQCCWQGMLVITVRAQDGRVAQPREHLLTQGMSGEEGHHAHCRQPASGEMGTGHLPVLQQQCLGCAAKLQVVTVLLPLTELCHQALPHEQHKALVHVQP